jgi:hypothetical protein
MIRRLTVTLVLLWCLAWMTACNHKTDAIIETSICAIITNPSTYDAKLVRVKATLKSDGLEHSNLVDPLCQSKAVAITAGPTDDAARRTLTTAIFAGRPGTYDKEVHAIFVGRFRWRPREIPARRIELITASDVSSTPKRK